MSKRDVSEKCVPRSRYMYINMYVHDQANSLGRSLKSRFKCAPLRPR